jgi:superfamily II DNA or RNA helicase
VIDLYPHQQQIIEALRRGYRDGHRCQMLALATGGGKTVIASHLIHGAAQKGNRESPPKSPQDLQTLRWHW